MHAIEPEPRTWHRRLHLSLNVPDLGAAADFYETLFGVTALHRRADHVRIDVEEPALNLALNPLRAGPSGPQSLSHLGVELRSAEDVAAVRTRIEEAGLALRVEHGVSCCYAVQDKLWVTDPGGNSWEFFTVLERNASQQQEPDSTCCVPAEASGAQSVCCPAAVST